MTRADDRTMSMGSMGEKDPLVPGGDQPAFWNPKKTECRHPANFYVFESQAEEDINNLSKKLKNIREEHQNQMPAKTGQGMAPRPDKAGFNDGDRGEEKWQEFTDVLKAHAEVWREIHPLQFVRDVSVLGPRLKKDYLDCLSLDLGEWPVWNDNWKEVLKFHRFRTGEYYVLDTVFDPLPEDWWNQGQGCWSQRRGAQCINLSRKNQEGWAIPYLRQFGQLSSEAYNTHWTSLSRLTEPEKPEHKVFIMKALYNTGADSGSFNSIASRVILDKYWEGIKFAYYRKVAFNVVFLAALAANTSWIMYSGDHHSPPMLMTRITGVFSVASVLGPLGDLILHIVFFRGAGFTEFCTFWNVSTAFVEIVVAAFLFPVLWLNNPKTVCEVLGPDLEPDKKHECSFDQHSVMYMGAIAVKWMHLILECMCIEFFGKSVLPAFSAITGAEMRKFMCFLAMVVAASFHAYWSLPIPENQPRAGVSNFWKAFTAVFKLDILGDFDVWDLEGINEVMNQSAGDIIEIDQGPESHVYHDGIQFMGLFLSCFVGVGAMNMSIGVLSKAYDENKARANHIYCHFKAGYAFKFLQRQVATNKLRTKIWEVLTCRCNSDEPEKTNREEGPVKGSLIRFDGNSYKDYEGSFASIEERLKRLEQNDEQNSERLEEVFRVIKFQLERLTGNQLDGTALARQGTRTKY